MKKASLAKISYEQGLQQLALRKKAIDSGKARPMSFSDRQTTFKLQPVGEKVALSLSGLGGAASGMLSGLTDKLKSGYSSVASNPELKRTLLSAGVGAGAGALTGLMAPDEKHKKRNVLMGALAGGALGGGLGLAANTGLVDKLMPNKKKISDVVSPERMSYLERNRLPGISSAGFNVDNTMPWATGIAGLGGASYAQHKGIKALTNRPFVDADRLEGGISGLLNNPPKTKGGKPVPFSNKNLLELFKDESGAVPKGILPSSKAKLADYLLKLSPDQRKGLFNKTGLIPDNVKGNAELIGRLQRAFGNSTASELIETATEKNPRIMQLLKGKAGNPRQALAMAALGIPALAQAYFGTKLLGTAGSQAYNSAKWQQLNNRIKQLQNQD